MGAFVVPERRAGRRTLVPLLVAAVAALALGPLMPAPVSAVVASSRFIWSTGVAGSTDYDGVLTSDDEGIEFVAVAPNEFYDPDTASIQISGWAELRFVGPDGAALSPGSYADATQFGELLAGHPAMFVIGAGGTSGGYCYAFAGAFTVLEVEYAAGIVTKLAVDYQMVCDGVESYGSLRFQSNVAATGVVHTPKDLLLQDFGRPAVGEHTDKTYTFTNAGETTVHIGAAALSGDNADDYSLPSDACSGATLVAGAGCDLTMRFTASALGPATATLELPMDTPDAVRTIEAFGLGSTPSTITVDGPGTAYIPEVMTFVAQVTPTPTGWMTGIVCYTIDGQGFTCEGVEADGSQTLTISLAQVGFQPGVHTISASYTGSDSPEYLRPAESTPIDFTVGIGTSVTLVSGRNPSLSTEPVPLTALVTSATGDPIDGGTLTITDAFNGATLGTLNVGPGATTLSVSPILATGTHALTAHFSGYGQFGPSDSTTLDQVVAKDVEVDVNKLSVAPKTFYPVVDHYRDTTIARGTLHEPGSVRFRVISVETGGVVRTASMSSVEGAYSWAWNGRNGSGTLQKAGRYRVEQTIRDTGDNVLKSTQIVELSHKKLYWYTASKTLLGGAFDKVLDPGGGWVRKSQSAYSGGVRIYSGGSAAGAGYTFKLVAAPAYGKLTFKVLGRSPSGDKAKIAIWNPSIDGAQYLYAYDAVANAGPGYGWWSTSASANSHRYGRVVNTLVAVFHNGAPVSFDIAKVQIVYRYAILK